MVAKFYERYWHASSEQAPDQRLKWPKLKRFIPMTNVTLVDVGCGNGLIGKEIVAINPKATYIGLDVSAEALKMARKHLPQARLRQIEDGGPLPLADASIDFVFSSEVLEHVYDTENAFREMARILKPGGRALLTVPYHGLLKNVLIALFAFDRHYDPIGAHVRFFTKRTLRRELIKVGVRPVRFGYYGRFWPFSHSIYVLAEK